MRATGAFIGSQIYRLSLTPMLVLVALTFLDVVIVWLTWLEYGRQKREVK